MSLRERKIAQTRIAIMEAVTAMLAERPLAEITVSEISEAVDISEMTFFNYFPAKSDVIVYFVQIWSVRVQWEMSGVLDESGSYLEAIEVLFATTAAIIEETPGVMAEIVAFQALNRAPIVFQLLSPAEYAQLFPEHKGIEEIEGRGVTALLREALRGAVALGELPADTDVDLVVLMLATVFFGTPVMTRQVRLDPAALYHRQLALIWRGVRAPLLLSTQTGTYKEQ